MKNGAAPPDWSAPKPAVGLSVCRIQGGTKMSPRTARLSRYSLIFWMCASLAGLSQTVAHADALYSVTDVGAANPSAAYLSGQSQLDPSGNYLSGLSPSQQAAFQAGSFDVYAHPGTGFNTSSTNPDYSPTGDPRSVQMVTGNNIGEFAGRGGVFLPQGYVATELLLYVPGQHAVPTGGHDQEMEASGYVYNLPLPASFGDNFYGTVARVKDRSLVTYNYQSPTATINASAGTWTPYISGPGSGTDLGTLGGASAVANALNNSNQVVGWSQTASGAQHAFLYSNGTMQDLNLLIPPLSGITLISGVGIDSAGDIVAYGTNSSGQTNEYFLTPLAVPAPEPSTLAIWGLITAVAAGRMAKRNARKERSKPN
jgi:probable HAF family extracellular repeat protein